MGASLVPLHLAPPLGPRWAVFSLGLPATLTPRSWSGPRCVSPAPSKPRLRCCWHPLLGTSGSERRALAA